MFRETTSVVVSLLSLIMKQLYQSFKSDPTSCSCIDVARGGGPPLSILPQPAPQLGNSCCAYCGRNRDEPAAPGAIKPSVSVISSEPAFS